jgi:hypothetical protein
MRININREKKVSIKRLTDADLNRSELSKQTHIGLSDKSFTFMGDKKRARSAILIHKNSWYVEPCDIGKIARKDGTYNAPKISMGGRNTENLVSRIRKITSTNRHAYYMMWFASDTDTPVFWLVRKGSKDFKKLNDAFDITEVNNNICTFSDESPEFESIVGIINEI